MLNQKKDPVLAFDPIRSYPVHPCKIKGFEVKVCINRDIQDGQDKARY